MGKKGYRRSQSLVSEFEEGCCSITWLDFKKKRNKLHTQRLIKREELATRQKELLSVTKNASVSLNQ